MDIKSILDTVSATGLNANTLVIIIGVLIIGYWQKHQIKTLEKRIDNQSKTLDEAKQIYEMLDVKKLRESTEYKVEAVEESKKLAIEKIKFERDRENSELKAKMTNELEMKDKIINTMSTRFDHLLPIFMDLFEMQSKSKREDILKEASGGVMELALIRLNEKIVESEENAMAAMARQGLTTRNYLAYPPKQGILANAMAASQQSEDAADDSST